MYTHFLIHYPSGTMQYSPTYPHIDLLHAVINCGIIPLDVPMEYSQDDGEFIPVPDDVRRDAWEFWTMVK